MKALGVLVASALFAAVIGTSAWAQTPGASNAPHHPAPSTGSSATPPADSSPGMKGGMPMMDMCRHMMSETMPMPMMGGGAPATSKERAEMLEMRGEMMKAMGDIMMKHAQRMQGPGK